jgi:putative DNA methylase
LYPLTKFRRKQVKMEQQQSFERRFIEEIFPVRAVSEESSREKSIRGENIATLHTWWARKPLSSSRAVNLESLIAGTKNPKDADFKKKLVINLSKVDNSLDIDLLNQAKKLIVEENGGKPPRVLDPFAGGGSIPMECARLGCETYASDYNPVAVLIQKCSFEYPSKYGVSPSNASGLADSQPTSSLLQDVRKWGNWILKKAADNLSEFYPIGSGGAIPVCYMWARTIPCQNPSCNAEIPLLTQYWLSRYGKSGVSLFPYTRSGQVHFRLVGMGGNPFPKGFDPENGNLSRAVVTCLVCGSVIDNKRTSKLFKTGKSSERLLAAIYHKKGQIGKIYKIADETDEEIFDKARKALAKKIKDLTAKWGFSPVPDEQTPEGNGPGAERAISLRNYNMNTWGELFNARQKLMLLTFIDLTRAAYQTMIREGYEIDYAKAVLSYLALGIDRLVDYGSTLCTLNSTGGRGVKNTFGRPILQMVWTYAESNPFNPLGGGWETSIEKNETWINYASNLTHVPIVVTQSSATSIQFPDSYFDAVFTDPPYYDNVPYSYLSDFFYVWLKRLLWDVFPDLFATPLTPKTEEIVAYSNRPGGFEEGKKFFLDTLRTAFKEISRVLKPNGVATIVYAHKSSSGWETLIGSLLDSDLVVTAAWPVHTEKKGRLRSQESAALASSIYMVSRKVERENIGFYKDVLIQLKKVLTERLNNIWNEGISGSDFFISAIGSSIQVFGRYEKIIDDEGNTVEIARLLEDVRKIVTDYAVKQVLHNGFSGEINQLTRFYILWRWAYGNVKQEFDDATKLAHGVGIDLEMHWNRGFIKKSKEFIEVLGPEDRKVDDLLGSSEMIDVLHASLLLWKGGKNKEMLDLLRTSGFGKNDVFYRVAQAISESLPIESTEKKLLDGFLPGRQRIVDDMRKVSGQRRLFEE